jgi:hypothetical protein
MKAISIPYKTEMCYCTNIAVEEVHLGILGEFSFHSDLILFFSLLMSIIELFSSNVFYLTICFNISTLFVVYNTIVYCFVVVCMLYSMP